ncbi:hypothetical protein M9434_003388 [Picochlorum sp. BPE23]|nr:hypothetical protein M9434_003388 [Picochlorum sp. BPE23]
MKSGLKATLTVALLLALFAGDSHAYSAFDLSSDVDFEELQDVATILQAQNQRALLQNYGGAPPVPEVVDEIIDAINDGTLDPNDIPGVDVEQTDSQITVTVQSDTPPTTTQLAEIGNKVATSINIPGVAVSTRTDFGDDGSIVIYVFLGQAEARLVEYYSRMLAAQANNTIAARRSLLQASSTSNTRFVVIGEDKAQVERFQRQLDNTLKNQTAMTEISNEVVEGSTAETEIITPSPPPPAPAPPLVCSYSGHFTISPLYSPCNRYFMAYVYPNCENTNVYLRTTRQLGNKPRRAVWRLLGGYLNGRTVSTAISAVERRRCPARNLQDTSGTSMLVASPEKQWTISPAGNGENCDQVNIFSEAKQAYLQVPRSCNSFSYASSDGGRQRFRLRQIG